ncbi:hypothetical protein MKX03_025973 [Papaver bracteatum]|nr:hypothetical protein MKX03_025973 [Papaver bracteatum]
MGLLRVCPTQVARHATKYFIRQSNATSPFDMSDTPAVPEVKQTMQNHYLLSVSPSTMIVNTTFNETSSPVETIVDETVAYNNFTPIPIYFPAFLPLRFPFLQPNLCSPSTEGENCGRRRLLF